MKRILGGVVSVLLCVYVVLPAAVYAQGTDDGQDSSDSSEQENAATERAVRIEAYKQRASDRLSAAQERKLAAACKAAQAKVRSLQSGLTTAVENRRGVYDSVATRLNDLVPKLQAASLDTTALEAALVELRSKAANVVQATKEYDELLDDLAAMDCESDPSGFKAALSVAREQRAAVLLEVQALKQYVLVDIKTILQELRTQLTPDPQSGAAAEGGA